MTNEYAIDISNYVINELIASQIYDIDKDMATHIVDVNVFKSYGLRLLYSKKNNSYYKVNHEKTTYKTSLKTKIDQMVATSTGLSNDIKRKINWTPPKNCIVMNTDNDEHEQNHDDKNKNILVE